VVQKLGTGSANIGTGSANILPVFWFWVVLGWHGRANLSTGRANILVTGASKFSVFLESYLDNYLQNNLKQRKTNKTKAIKCVGCLPRSARLMSLA
jgi:surface polysaccharide O-acyltransferase-like enzyme